MVASPERIEMSTPAEPNVFRNGSECNPDPNSFGHILCQLREKAGRSRNSAAKEAGIDCSYWTRIEWGDRDPPRPDILDAMARVLGLDAEDRTRLFWTAGYVSWRPDEMVGFEAVQAVTAVLGDWRIDPDRRLEFARLVEALARMVRTS